MSGWPSSSWFRTDSISTRHCCSSASSDLRECSAIAFKGCLLAGEVLPPENGQFNVLRIDVHAVANALGDLGGDERCSTSQEGIVHGLASDGMVLDRPAHELQWLLRGVIELPLLGAAHDELWGWRIP